MKASLRRTILPAVARMSAPFVNQASLPASVRRPRILLIRPDHVGDVLFTTPAVRALRSALPEAYIAYLAGPWSREIVQDNPHLDNVISCPFPGFTRRPKAHSLEPYVVLWKHARSVRAMAFDVAVVLRFDHWWGAMLTYWAGIPVRVGYALPESTPFLTDALEYERGHHEVEQNMRLVSSAVDRDLGDPGPLEFTPRPEDVRSALDLLKDGSPEGKYLCLHPGAGAPVKLWRPEAFAQAADAIGEKYGLQVIITGSSGEKGLAQEIADQMERDPLTIVGQTNLGELAAIMGQCELVIGTDSGPLHLAVSQGVPTVHLYGPVDHRTFGPWGDLHKHIVVRSDRDCIPCNRLDYATHELPDHPCVRSITVGQVLRAADSVLGLNSAAKNHMI
ncbi:MAG: glycosyltransferase family 9 protein [Anaerolineae bacterium]|nr:glycosyltransferase family 9 protein [Anaerolineae bacterium]NIN93837.1 glycosyltransferase family 9 protein [Anaerolineae bacterium]NIQ76872.1 glycosyltransferase family 9 protein [Anaerolineae bacterium]